MTGGQIGNVDLVKQLNSAAVYRLIDQQGPISRIQVADVSNLAPASVTKITRQLLERGLIKEVAHQASTGGRRAISLTTECSPFHSIAVRLGRDVIEISLFDLSSKELARQSEAFSYASEAELIEGLMARINQFLAANQSILKELIAIGVTLPGLIDPENGIVDYMPNIQVDKMELGQLVSEEFGVACFLGNDTRAQALAEHYFGVSKKYQDALLVSVHNGTGAGIIVNGQIFLGSNRNVGEIGHVQIDPLGDKCQCGNFGCLETVAANSAIIENVKKLLAQGYNSPLGMKENISVYDVCDAALQGDALAEQVLLKVGHHLGKAIAMTINLFNPQQIIISGEITRARDIVFPAIQRCIETQSLKKFHINLPVVAAELQDTPTIGAFSLVKRAMLNGVLLQKLLEE